MTTYDLGVSSLPPPDQVPPPPRTPKVRWVLIVMLVLGLLVGGSVGWLFGRRSAPSRAHFAANEFCALGAEEGANLLDVTGWLKAAQRTNADWQAVLRSIDGQCPTWRDQVAKSGSIGNP